MLTLPGAEADAILVAAYTMTTSQFVIPCVFCPSRRLASLVPVGSHRPSCWVLAALQQLCPSQASFLREFAWSGSRYISRKFAFRAPLQQSHKGSQVVMSAKYEYHGPGWHCCLHFDRALEHVGLQGGATFDASYLAPPLGHACVHGSLKRATPCCSLFLACLCLMQATLQLHKQMQATEKARLAEQAAATAQALEYPAAAAAAGGVAAAAAAASTNGSHSVAASAESYAMSSMEDASSSNGAHDHSSSSSNGHHVAVANGAGGDLHAVRLSGGGTYSPSAPHTGGLGGTGVSGDQGGSNGSPVKEKVKLQ